MGKGRASLTTVALRTLLYGSAIGALAWLSIGLTPATPLASAQTTAPTALAANGRNAQVVEFGSSGSKGGEFRVTGSRAWTELGVDGKEKFRFEETNRDDWSVYLFDRGRSVHLQLDMYTRKVMYGNTPSGMYQIYEILGASPASSASSASSAPTTTSEAKKVTGRDATVIEYGTGDQIQGVKQGELSQIGPGAWADYDTHGKIKSRLKEVSRDDSSVYLRGCSNKTDLQIDLHTRKIISKDSGSASVFSNVRNASALPVSVQAEFAAGAPPAPTTDCGYVIASVEPDDTLRYLRAPADTGSALARPIVNRDPVRDPCTGELLTDSFWSLIPQSTMKVVPPRGQTPVDAFVMNIVSVRTGNTLQFDPDGYLKVVSPYAFQGAPPKFIFVPTGYVGGNTPATFEIRELTKDGTPGRKVLTFDDRKSEPAADMVALNKPTEALLSGPDASHYRRNFAVFSPNCPAVGGIYSRNPNISAEHTQLQMSRWGIQGDMSPITKFAANLYANWPPAYRDLYRMEGSATLPALCPPGTVAVGLGLFGDRAERRTLICRRYQGAAKPSQTFRSTFAIADQGSGGSAGVPAQGELATPGALTGLTCGSNRVCSMNFIDGFASNQCRWMEGPRIDYWDGLVRDIDKGARSLIPDKWFRPSNEVWCDGANEVLTGLNCIHAQKPAGVGVSSVFVPKKDHAPFCDRLGLRCCKAPGTYAGNLDSPHGPQNQTSVWSALYGYDATLNKDAPNLSFSCPVGHVASGFDCGDSPTTCKNKSLGCKKIGLQDDGNRTVAARTVDSTGAGVYERGLAVTGMKCNSPSCRELTLQHVKLRSDNTSHETCRWAALTNADSSSPSQCTASEYLADIRCKNGNDCSDFVEMKCCIDSTGRLPSSKSLLGTSEEMASPPRVPPKPVNQKQVECRAPVMKAILLARSPTAPPARSTANAPARR